MLDNKDDRIGNELPLVTSGKELGRESILYSYQNTVSSSYVGDVRHIVTKFGDYLATKGAYYDPKKNMLVKFPIRYAAPNLVFSDDKGLSGNAPETSIKDRITLPIISYYLTGFERDAKRAIDPAVRYWYKPKDSMPGKVLVTTSPRATNFSFQVDIWTENRESYYQLSTAFQLDFNPYSYLTDLYLFDDETQKTFYMPYAKMTLESATDGSNYIPGTDRRLVRGTLKITVEGWLTQPPTELNYVFNTNIVPDSSILGDSSQNTIVDENISNQFNDINSTYNIILAQSLPLGSPIRIINNKAYQVTSIDAITPSVNAVTLEPGLAGQLVSVGNYSNGNYIISDTPFQTDSLLYLSKTGTLTTDIPSLSNGDKYLLSVGKAVSGTNSFIFDPKTSIHL